jgi:AraC-like DNA-binding protein
MKRWFDPPSPEKGEFRTNGIGIREKMAAGIVDRPAGTGDYLFMFFYDPVTIRVDGTDRDYPAGHLVAWTPDQGHYYGNPSRRWSHSWLHCEGAFVHRALRACHAPRMEPFPLADPSLFEDFLAALHQELTSHARPDGVIAGNLFENWLRAAVRSNTNYGKAPVPDKYLRVRRYIESHYTEPLTLERLAAMAHVSVPHFCSEFRKYFGTTAIELTIRLRMKEALHHLRNHRRSISEIAELVGYQDIYYFSKLFRKRFGVSAREMRRRVSGTPP